MEESADDGFEQARARVSTLGKMGTPKPLRDEHADAPRASTRCGVCRAALREAGLLAQEHLREGPSATR